MSCNMKLPELDKGDMPDIKTLSVSDLDKIPADKYKMHCCVFGCSRWTGIKDFGIIPFVYWGKRWVDLSRIVFYCSKHYGLYRKSISFGGYKPKEGFKDGPALMHISKTFGANFRESSGTIIQKIKPH